MLIGLPLGETNSREATALFDDDAEVEQHVTSESRFFE
jgi:hypothetical protein